jgi:hypothetical protein
VAVVIEERIAASLREQLDAILASRDTTPIASAGSEGDASLVLDNDHPLWEQHTGLEGHRGREWGTDDSQLAEAFYASVGGKAKIFLDLMISHPGQLLDVDEICELRPNNFSSSRSIAGALNGLRIPHLASERRYPFYWWAGSPTRYGMKPLTASLFLKAKRKLET